MTTILYAIAILFFILGGFAIFKSFFNLGEIDKRIGEMYDEERRQNKRIDILEKREQMRQLEQSHDKAYVEAKDLFKENDNGH